jgi:hypothetical protein
MGLASPPGPTTQQMLLREVQDLIYHDKHNQIQGGRRTFVYQPFITTDFLNWKHHIPSFAEKPQALIDPMQPTIQAHKPTWPTASSYSI